MRVKVIFETDLLERPSLDAKILGRLPEGAVLIAVGRQRGQYVLVEVKLRSGRTLEGWVAESRIQPDEKPKRLNTNIVKEKRTVSVPKDEIDVLKREKSFLYGGHLGVGFGFITPDALINDLIYSGISFSVGIHGGVYITEEIPLRIEASFSKVNGTNSDDVTNLGFTFLDLTAMGAYLLESFELSAGLQYSFGLGLNEVPGNLILDSASEVSSLWGVAGVGYRIPLGRYAVLVVQGRYGISFVSSPFRFQTFSLFGILEWSG